MRKVIAENKEAEGVETMQSKIDGWKKQFGRVFRLDVDGHTAYVKAPDRRTLSLAAVEGGKDPIKYNEVVLRNCWIEGDEEIKTNDGLFLGASAKLQELIDVKEAELKEL